MGASVVFQDQRFNPQLDLNWDSTMGPWVSFWKQTFILFSGKESLFMEWAEPEANQSVFFVGGGARWVWICGALLSFWLKAKSVCGKVCGCYRPISLWMALISLVGSKPAPMVDL